MPKKKTNYHVVFGQLVHVAGDLWKRPIELHIFGRNWTTDLMVDIDQKDGVEQNQIRGYQTFEEHTEQVVSNSENAIVDYYRSICNEYRDRYGIVDANDEKVPIVKGKRDVFKLLTLEGVTFP